MMSRDMENADICGIFAPPSTKHSSRRSYSMRAATTGQFSRPWSLREVQATWLRHGQVDGDCILDNKSPIPCRPGFMATFRVSRIGMVFLVSRWTDGSRRTLVSLAVEEATIRPRAWGTWRHRANLCSWSSMALPGLDATPAYKIPHLTGISGHLQWSWFFRFKSLLSSSHGLLVHKGPK